MTLYEYASLLLTLIVLTVVIDVLMTFVILSVYPLVHQHTESL